MTHVGWYIAPNHPEAKAEALRRNRNAGWAPVPGISDHEMGTVLQADGPLAPLWVPHIDLPPVRTVAAPGRYKPMLAALGLAALVGLLASVLAQ